MAIAARGNSPIYLIAAHDYTLQSSHLVRVRGMSGQSIASVLSEEACNWE